MVDFLLHPDNVPFAIALGLMTAIGLLEFATALMGFGLSGIIHSIIPESHFHVDFDAHWHADAGVDIHADPGVDIADGVGTEPHGLDLGYPGRRNFALRFLIGLGFGRAPILVLLVLFLLAFGLSGLVFQFLSVKIIGRPLNGWLISIPAFAAALVLLRITGATLARIMPKTGGQAISERTFIGRTAQITLGTARFGRPAQAKLRDGYGQTHYVMVQPEKDGMVFETGWSVLLLEQKGAVFTAVQSPIDAVDDMPPEPVEEPEDE